MKKVFDTTEKMNLILGTETFVYNYRGQTFPVVLGQVCAHCSRDFGPLWPTLGHLGHFGPFWPTPPYRSFPDLSDFRAVAGQHKVSAPSKDFLLGSGLETG